MGSLLSSSITASMGLAEGAVQLYHNKYMDTPAWFKVGRTLLCLWGVDSHEGGGCTEGGGCGAGEVEVNGSKVVLFACKSPRWRGVLHRAR